MLYLRFAEYNVSILMHSSIYFLQAEKQWEKQVKISVIFTTERLKKLGSERDLLSS